MMRKLKQRSSLVGVGLAVAGNSSGECNRFESGNNRAGVAMRLRPDTSASQREAPVAAQRSMGDSAFISRHFARLEKGLSCGTNGEVESAANGVLDPPTISSWQAAVPTAYFVPLGRAETRKLEPSI